MLKFEHYWAGYLKIWRAPLDPKWGKQWRESYLHFSFQLHEHGCTVIVKLFSLKNETGHFSHDGLRFGPRNWGSSSSSLSTETDKHELLIVLKRTWSSRQSEMRGLVPKIGVVARHEFEHSNATPVVGCCSLSQWLHTICKVSFDRLVALGVNPVSEARLVSYHRQYFPENQTTDISNKPVLCYSPQQIMHLLLITRSLLLNSINILKWYAGGTKWILNTTALTWFQNNAITVR